LYKLKSAKPETTDVDSPRFVKHFLAYRAYCFKLVFNIDIFLKDGGWWITWSGKYVVPMAIVCIVLICCDKMYSGGSEHSYVYLKKLEQQDEKRESGGNSR